MDKGPGPRLNLLRGFTLTVGHERIPLIWSAQRLVAFLALQHRAVGRTVVAGTLWPETTSIKANANLRSSLWRAQRSCTHLVDASAQQLLLAPDVVVDVHRATKAAHRLLADGSCDEVLTGTTQADLSADLLPDWYDDDWILVDREQYHHLRLYALEAMCRRLTASRRHGEAVDAGLAAVRADPLRESAHHALIAAHLAAGNRCEAIRQYEKCRDLLRRDLDLEPSAALRSLLPVPLSQLEGRHPHSSMPATAQAVNTRYDWARASDPAFEARLSAHPAGRAVGTRVEAR